MKTTIPLSVRRRGPGDKPHGCEVQPTEAQPKGCHERAAYVLSILDSRSWLCAEHFWEVKAALDRGEPCRISPTPGRN